MKRKYKLSAIKSYTDTRQHKYLICMIILSERSVEKIGVIFCFSLDFAKFSEWNRIFFDLSRFYCMLLLIFEYFITILQQNLLKMYNIRYFFSQTRTMHSLY